MSYVTPESPRYKVEETTEGLRIEVHNRRQLFLLFFLPLWLCLWAFGWYDTAKKIAYGDARDLFTIIWFAAWSAAGPFVTLAWLWNLIGTESILVTPSELYVKKAIFGICRVRTFGRADIHDVRYRPESGSGRSRTQSAIVFDYGARTYSFATELDEAEAVPIIAAIKNRMSLAEESPIRNPIFRSLD